jgi:hypothetical protein
MKIQTVANFTASDLKQSGPVLDAAVQGVVQIKRRGEVFLLMREAEFDLIIEEAADPRPKSLADLLVDYDAEDVKARLSNWIKDAPTGKEAL